MELLQINTARMWSGSADFTLANIRHRQQRAGRSRDRRRPPKGHRGAGRPPPPSLSPLPPLHGGGGDEDGRDTGGRYENSSSAATAGATPPATAATLLELSPLAPPVRRTFPVIPHGSELVVGIIIGTAVSGVIMIVASCLWSQKTSSTPPQAAAAAALPKPTAAGAGAAEGGGLAEGRLYLRALRHHGASYHRFSWAPDMAGGSSSAAAAHVQRIVDSGGQEIACAIGRLMAAPNGEMRLEARGTTWAVLRRAAPSRRPGQLWDFKICRADGAPFAEVRQRSDTKCLVDDAMSQLRFMTVIGNFTYPVFLSGERNINLWITQGDSPPTQAAQCEAHPEAAVATAVAPAAATEAAAAAAVSMESSRLRFHVTSTVSADASLIIAVLLGLQDVHQAAVSPSYPSGESGARLAFSIGGPPAVRAAAAKQAPAVQAPATPSDAAAEKSQGVAAVAVAQPLEEASAAAVEPAAELRTMEGPVLRGLAGEAAAQACPEEEAEEGTPAAASQPAAATAG